MIDCYESGHGNMKLYRKTLHQTILKRYPAAIAEIGNKQRKILVSFQHRRTLELDKE
jgi:hypothetical protein